MADFVRHRGPFLPVAGSALDRAFKTKEVIYVDDDAAEVVPTIASKFGGARSYIAVPMLKDDEVDRRYLLSIARRFARSPTSRLSWCKNFAAQAVIAIENTRLLNELRQRTDDLTESLEQQTATSEVLRVISSSPGELEPVFQAMLENATRICEAKFGMLLRFDGEAFRLRREVGAPPELAEYLRQRGPFQPVPGSHLDRLMRDEAGQSHRRLCRR